MKTEKLKILRKKYTQIRLLGQQIDNSLSNDLTKCEIEIKIKATDAKPENAFDLFVLRNSSDFECYMRAISDFSFSTSDAYACPFLSDANATHLNQTTFTYSIPKFLLRDIEQKNFYFIIDNTPFPATGGVYGDKAIDVEL